eukprot:scaffold69317_cov37-Tisochrysis_lutea.AAC.1
MTRDRYGTCCGYILLNPRVGVARIALAACVACRASYPVMGGMCETRQEQASKSRRCRCVQ